MAIEFENIPAPRRPSASMTSVERAGVVLLALGVPGLGLGVAVSVGAGVGLAVASAVLVLLGCWFVR